MSAIDIIILIVVILLLLVIIFFNYIFPRIKHQNTHCSCCPTVKRAKRLVKDFKSEENKKK